MVMVISFVPYATCVGIGMTNPAWLISRVLTSIPGTVMFLAKKIVLGHLLQTSSNWLPTIGLELSNASRYVSRFGFPSFQLGYFEPEL